jgi:hypothetical protein
MIKVYKQRRADTRVSSMHCSRGIQTSCWPTSRRARRENFAPQGVGDPSDN